MSSGIGDPFSITAGFDLSFPVTGSMSTNTAGVGLERVVLVLGLMVSAISDSVPSLAGFGRSLPVIGSMTAAIGTRRRHAPTSTTGTVAEVHESRGEFADR